MENYRDELVLYHHGIMGMKWGVWNEETRRKRLGTGKRTGAKKSAGKKSNKNIVTPLDRVEARIGQDRARAIKKHVNDLDILLKAVGIAAKGVSLATALTGNPLLAAHAAAFVNGYAGISMADLAVEALGVVLEEF